MQRTPPEGGGKQKQGKPAEEKAPARPVLSESRPEREEQRRQRSHSTGQAPTPKRTQSGSPPRMEEPQAKGDKRPRESPEVEPRKRREEEGGENVSQMEGKNRGGGETHQKPLSNRAYLEQFQNLITDCNKQLAGDKTALPKRQIVIENLSKMQSMFETVLMRNVELTTENKMLKSQKPISYAAVTSTPKVNMAKQQLVKESTQKQKHTVFLTSEGKNGKDVQLALTKTINPAKNKIKIRRMRTIANAVIIETESKEDSEKLLKNEDIKKANLKAELPRKKNPLVIIYDTPVSTTAEDLKAQIYEQNFADIISEQEYEEGFKFRFKTGARNKPIVHQVVEVSARMRHLMVQKGRLFAGFASHPVKDYVVVPRCHKCQDLGHVAKWCKAEKMVCAHCGEQDHTKNDCKKSKQASVCIPCMLRKKKCGAECPTYKMMLERIIERTDYGQF